MSHRLESPAGTWIDRSHPLAFTFNGRQLSGCSGDTLASALLANDVQLVGRSFKLHRPRGVWSCGVEEPNAIVDVVHDSSPIIGPTPVPGLYINCGWGTGGFKAIPAGGWTLAHVLATGRNHELAEPFQLERFTTGRLVDEAAAAGIAH